MRFGLIFGSNVQQSPNVDCARTINLMPRLSESPTAKSPMALYSTPGAQIFGVLPKRPVRGQYAINDRGFGLGDRFFVVAGDTLWEVFRDGDHQDRGTVLAGTTPVSICSSGTQILICCRPGASGVANVFLYDLNMGTFGPVDQLTDQNISMVTYLKGFFVGMVANSRNFRCSDVNDGLSWPDDLVGVKEGSSDSICSIAADHEELILFGTRTTEVWAVTGNLDFPFQLIQGAVIEQGNAAQFSGVLIDNSLMWIGGDTRGEGIAWRASGYTPERISNHAFENAVQGYAKIDDAEGYAYQYLGQTFAVWRFPSAQATWVYDVSTKLWHERGWWDQTQGKYLADRSRCHSFVFGKHITGDWENGNLYWVHKNFYDWAGNPLRRLRRSPHVCDELKLISHLLVRLDIEVGVGGSPREPIWNEMTQQWQEVSETWDSLRTEGGVDPQVMMRFSNDGGKTWSPEQWRTIGKAGEYGTVVDWRRQGMARDRVYEFVISDGVPVSIADGYLEALKGSK